MLNGIRICALVLAAALSWTPMAEAQDQDQVYGVLMKTLSNPFWGAMEEGVRDGASEIGVDYFLQAVESDQAAEPQLNPCMTMLERNPAVMITATITSTILLPCLKPPTARGTPVIQHRQMHVDGTSVSVRVGPGCAPI